MNRLIIGLLTAAVMALGGWVLKVDRAVASQETLNQAIMQRLDDIHQDLRELRLHLMNRESR